jgi:two-component system NtrC family sensor kinase
MLNQRERILLVENDRQISDVIAWQALQPLGYRVEIAADIATAIQEAGRYSPDLIIANLKLPGLTGKDLLVALSSQGLDIPVIALSAKGAEKDIIQAFRLGAVDFLLWPSREAEIVSAVERILKQVRARREREALARQLHQTNQELQRRVRELTTLSAIGKAVTSITDHHNLLERIVQGAVSISDADSGWLLLRDGQRKAFTLGAQRNLPDDIAGKVGQPWEDGVSTLVAISGEPLSIHGEPIKRFKISRLGLSALVMPVKAKSEVVGLLAVLRKEALPFGPNIQTLLGAVTDYASISIVNAHLFKALQERALHLQQVADAAQESERSKDKLLRRTAEELYAPIEALGDTLSSMLAGETGRVNDTQKNVLRQAQHNLQRMYNLLESIAHK